MKYLLLARAAASRLMASPRPAIKWVAWVAVALMPGSFMVIPLIWVARQLRAQTS